MCVRYRPSNPHRALTAAGFLIASLAISSCRGPVEVIDDAGPAAGVPAHSIVPLPASAELSSTEMFMMTDATQIVVEQGDAEAARIGLVLAELVGNTVETTPALIASGSEGIGSHIRLERDGDVRGDEGYVLDIAADGVTLRASAPAGFFYGVQTIRQLLPPYVEYEAAYPLPLTLPVGRIVDEPRFEWRGSMLDVARHFFEPENVKRYIDLMAMYKLNRLHLHLSDDQGWRIEVPSRPRLTIKGAGTEVGGRTGGSYSRSEWRDLVRYAEDRFITLVPEIDMPGHTNAALASYPEVTCDEEPRDVYTGTEVGFSYLCVEKEETYEFVEDVVRDIAEVTPGPYFHLGGDEVHELTEEQYVRFMERAQEIVARYGKRVVGWDEIAEVDLDLLPETIVQVWRPQTEETARAVADAVDEGASLILSPADHIYIDLKYDSTSVLGLTWAGYNPVRDAYDWDPAEYAAGVSESAILGVEAPLWTETLSTMSDLEYMAFPRLPGVAEIGWSPAAARNWNTYRLRLGAQAPRWTALGVNFYRAPGVPWQEMERPGVLE